MTATRVANARALLTGPRSIELVDMEVAAEVPPGHVRVRTIRTLVSTGTELRMYRGLPLPAGMWRAFAKLDDIAIVQRASIDQAGEDQPAFPAALGYNLLGEVIAVGEGVTRPAPGDRIVSLARHQAVVDLPAWQASPVPTGVEDNAAVCGYIPTLGLHALRRTGYTPGENVTVVGLGLVGAAAALVADAVGARVRAVEPAPERAARVQRLAPSIEVLAPDEVKRQADSADVVIEAAGTASALRLSLRLARESGRVAVTALHHDDLGAILAGDFFLKELRILASRNDPYEDPRTSASRHTIASNVETVLRMAATGRPDLAGLVTTVVRWRELPLAFNELDAGVAGHLGVAVDWSGAALP